MLNQQQFVGPLIGLGGSNGLPAADHHAEYQRSRDGGGGNNSVFAKAFFDELEQNDALLAAPQLYLRVKDRVTVAAKSVDFFQEPDFKTIKAAGHEVGDFFFVPKTLR